MNIKIEMKQFSFWDFSCSFLSETQIENWKKGKLNLSCVSNVIRFIFFAIFTVIIVVTSGEEAHLHSENTKKKNCRSFTNKWKRIERMSFSFNEKKGQISLVITFHFCCRFSHCFWFRKIKWKLNIRRQSNEIRRKYVSSKKAPFQ